MKTVKAKKPMSKGEQEYVKKVNTLRAPKGNEAAPPKKGAGAGPRRMQKRDGSGPGCPKK